MRLGMLSVIVSFNELCMSERVVFLPDLASVFFRHRRVAIPPATRRDEDVLVREKKKKAKSDM